MRVLGWVPTKEAPGVMLGTLHLRSHTAVVRVDYTTDSYRITYMRSQNLDYERRSDGSEVIHVNYNSWIANLTREINKRLPS